jgi:hypothetical protein
MSRSTFLSTSSFDANETTSLSPANSNPNADHGHTLRFHHRLMPTISSSSRSNETVPVVVLQTLSTTTTTDLKTTTMNTAQHKSVVRINPAVKRNLRGKRRSTGIRPDEVSLANAVVDVGEKSTMIIYHIFCLLFFSFLSIKMTKTMINHRLATNS